MIINNKFNFVALQFRRIMKKLFTLVAFVLLSVSFGMAQETASQDTAVITFDKTMYDLGTITPGSHPLEFTFTNTGKGILLVTNVHPTCGCTIASWTKEPIKPGEKGVVKATYNASAVGPVTKSLTVNSNSKTPVMSLTFKATVVSPAKEESTDKTTSTNTK
jgi:hypothetical protein